MKRMSEVFELPLFIDRYGMNDAKNNTLINDDAVEEEYLVAAAHAINNVDALADTLETVLSVLSGKTEFSASEIDIESCYEALNAYRGAK